MASCTYNSNMDTDNYKISAHIQVFGLGVFSSRIIVRNSRYAINGLID